MPYIEKVSKENRRGIDRKFICTSGWTTKDCDAAIAYAILVNEDLSCFGHGEEDIASIKYSLAQWPREERGWWIWRKFYKELVKNNIITNYKNKEEYDKVHIQQGTGA